MTITIIIKYAIPQNVYVYFEKIYFLFCKLIPLLDSCSLSLVPVFRKIEEKRYDISCDP